MVYTDKDKKIVKFPKISNDSINRIEFINQVTNQKITFVPDVMNKTNIVCTIDLSPISDQFVEGQYDYYFYNSNNDVIDSGILQFGNFDANLVEYNTEKNIIQYDK